MSRHSRTIMLALMSLALCSCVHTPTGQPGWVNEPHTDFPADQYLVGVASGSTCDDAVDQAIARIAQQIEVRVNATEQRRSLTTAVESAGAEKLLMFESEIRLDTSATLLGVEVVETAATTNESCAALVVLDIDRSIGLYDDRIAFEDRLIRFAKDRADRSASVWSKYIDISAAMQTALRRDHDAMTRSVLAARGNRTQAPSALVAPTLIDRYEALHEQLSLSVVPIGDCPEILARKAEAVLADRGLPIEHDYPGSIQIRIGWQGATEQTYDPRWWVCRWRLNVALYDAQRGETITRPEPISGDAYGLGEEAAIEEALAKASTQLESLVSRALDHPESDIIRQWRDTMNENTIVKEPTR